MGGFLQGFYGVVGPKMEELHQIEDQQRGEKAQPFWKTLADPSTTDVQRKQAQDALLGLYGKNKEAKQKLQRAFQMHDALAQRTQQQPDKPNTGGWRQATPQETQQSQATQVAGPGLQLPTVQSAPPGTQIPGRDPGMSPERHGVLNKILGGIKQYGKNLGDELGVGVQGKLRDARQAQTNADIDAGLQTPSPDRDYRQKIATIRGAVERGEITEAKGKEMMQDAVYQSVTGKPPTASARPVIEHGLQRDGMEGNWTKLTYPDGTVQWDQEAKKTGNMQQKWTKNDDGSMRAVWVDPKDPDRVFDNGQWKTASEVPLVDQAEALAKIRQDSYGAFGNYFRAERGKGRSEEDARRIAGEMVEKEWGVKLGRQEQQIAIDAALSGIGGGAVKPPAAGSAPPPGASSPGGASPGAKALPAPTPSKAPTSSALPQKSAITGLTPTDEDDIRVFFGSLVGNIKGGGKAQQVRVQKGLNTLGRLTGLDPLTLNAELANDKATAAALAEAVKVAGAFGRVQETLKAHGQVLLDAAKAYGPGGLPLANRTIQWVQQNVTADPSLQKYLLSIQAVQREYARLVSGGVQSRAMLPVAAQEKGEAVLRPDATMGQLAAAVEQLKIEADTEQKAFSRQQEDLKEKLRSGPIGSAVTGGSPAPATGGGPKPKTGAEYLKSIGM